MNTYRKTAIIVGVLFITATVTAILSGVFLGTMLDAPDYLINISANENQVAIAMLFELILAISVLGIGVLLFPVLKKVMEGLALGYAAIRLAEAILIIIASICVLSLLTVSQEYAAGNLDYSYAQSLGTLLLAIRDWSHVYGTFILLGLGGMPLYFLLYQSKLIPRWLSVWGLIGATLILLAGLLGLFGLSPTSTTSTVFALPIGLQEMVFAVWLIVKGFDPSATVFQATKTDKSYANAGK